MLRNVVSTFNVKTKWHRSLADHTPSEWYEFLMKNFTWISEGSFLPCILWWVWCLVEKRDDKSAAWIKSRCFRFSDSSVSKICVANFRDRLTGKFCLSPELRGVFKFSNCNSYRLICAMCPYFIYRFITLTLFTRFHVFRSIIIGANVPLLALLFYILLVASRNRTNNEKKTPFQRGDEQILTKFHQL